MTQISDRTIQTIDRLRGQGLVFERLRQTSIGRHTHLMIFDVSMPKPPEPKTDMSPEQVSAALNKMLAERDTVDGQALTAPAQ